MKQLATIGAQPILLALTTAPSDRALLRFLKFFAANIRNPHMRRACGRAMPDFLAWYDDNRIPPITSLQPLHVTA